MSDNVAQSAAGQHFNCGGTVKVCTDGKYTWAVCLKCEQNVMMVPTQTEAKSR